jgi:hypothetical protein
MGHPKVVGSSLFVLTRRGKREEGRGKREEGRGKREEGSVRKSG